MSQRKIIIKNSKSIIIRDFFILFLIVIFLIIYMVKCMKPNIYLIFFVCFVLFICIEEIFINFRFCVEVKDNNFKVRTKILKKYQFNISEIKKIFFSQEKISRGIYSYWELSLKIITESKELKLDLDMLGFRELIEYLLQKYDARDLDRKVISKRCYDCLIRYKDNNEIKTKLIDKIEEIISKNYSEELDSKQIMFKTQVILKHNLNKEYLKLLILIGIWFILFMVFFIASLKVTFLLLPFVFIIFLCIIPIGIFCRKKTKKLIAKSIVNKEVVFYIQNENLYIDGIKLTVEQDKSTNEIYIYDFYDFERCKNCGFCIIIQGLYVEDFITFLKKNNIYIYNTKCPIYNN